MVKAIPKRQATTAVSTITILAIAIGMIMLYLRGSGRRFKESDDIKFRNAVEKGFVLMRMHAMSNYKKKYAIVTAPKTEEDYEYVDLEHEIVVECVGEELTFIDHAYYKEDAIPEEQADGTKHMKFQKGDGVVPVYRKRIPIAKLKSAKIVGIKKAGTVTTLSEIKLTCDRGYLLAEDKTNGNEVLEYGVYAKFSDGTKKLAKYDPATSTVQVSDAAGMITTF